MNANDNLTHYREPVHWANYRKYVFQESIGGPGFTLSINLDAGIWTQFSDIEILNIFKEGMSESDHFYLMCAQAT